MRGVQIRTGGSHRPFFSFVFLQLSPAYYGLGAFLGAGLAAGFSGAFLDGGAVRLINSAASSALKGKPSTDSWPVVLSLRSTRRLLASTTASKFLRIFLRTSSLMVVLC